MTDTSPQRVSGKTIPRRAVTVLREDGMREFVRKSLNFALTRSVRAVVSTDDDGVRDRAITRTQVEPAESVTVRYSGRSRSDVPALIREREGEIGASPRDVLEFADAKVIGETALTKVGRTYFYPTSVGNLRPNFPVSRRALSTIASPTPPPDRRLEFGYFFGAERNGFAHWFYEQLPKLRWYENYCARIERKPELIVQEGLSDWQIRSLELVGYPPGSYVRFREGETLGVDRLAIPPHPRRTRAGEFQVCPSAVRWIGETIRSNVPQSDRDFPDRVYVSRADAERRRVVNEGTAVSRLEEHGFEWFEPSRLPFDDQVRLFKSADLIVGPHGAGLTSMIYADDAHVLELLTEEAGEHFFMLANECGHSYEFVRCDPIIDGERKPRHRDMRVDLEALEDRIVDLL